MKATGIVRRIDDLGRVVIPKELRRTLRIRDGDPLEIYTEKDGEVIFKKYSPVGEISQFAATICEALWKAGDCACAVCDRDAVLACAGLPKKELLEKPVSDAVAELMESRKLYASPAGAEIPFVVGEDAPCVVAAAPVLAEGDVLGCVAFVAKAGAPAATEVQEKLAAAVAAFLGKQMET